MKYKVSKTRAIGNTNDYQSIVTFSDENLTKRITLIVSYEYLTQSSDLSKILTGKDELSNAEMFFKYVVEQIIKKYNTDVLNFNMKELCFQNPSVIFDTFIEQFN